ncbi:Protein PROTON GRADIENT REGULATION 5, chloroplastic [Musa troglodytarum]|uniref:Protein PROTON GRADIENT REGULATION 5, chloroplastic n=1 Tax=Musa troglodytarum TaxID=320322 RepID=A0A9E7GFH1_9LILI|nr:Protein PROTON GRADIENT REGULATION 5, chloroplastic [Musa troglodytarum]
MLGAFAPQRDPHELLLEEETTPFGVLARGIYSAKLKVKWFRDDAIRWSRFDRRVKKKQRPCLLRHSQSTRASKAHHRRVNRDLHCVASIRRSKSKPQPHTPGNRSSSRVSSSPPLRACARASMAASPTAAGCRALPSCFHGSWATSFPGEDRAALARHVTGVLVRAARPRRSSPRMGNVNEGKGLFAPVVVLVRNIIGRKRFDQFRGKAIAVHSQVGVDLLLFLIVMASVVARSGDHRVLQDSRCRW